MDLSKDEVKQIISIIEEIGEPHHNTGWENDYYMLPWCYVYNQKDNGGCIIVAVDDKGNYAEGNVEDILECDDEKTNKEMKETREECGITESGVTEIETIAWDIGSPDHICAVHNAWVKYWKLKKGNKSVK